MGYLKNLVLFVPFFALLTFTSLGQVKDWDDVSKADLEMDIYPSDSSAAAVVLFDKAEVDLNRDLEYVMDRHVRIKILREEGYKWAETEIAFNEELDQEISRLRGHTFTLSDDGKINKHKLDKNSIFEENISEDYSNIKFTLPSLEPGAIVEYRYRKHIGSPHLLPDWNFQRSIPVAWSEYRVKVPDWFFYNIMFVGNHPLHINESEPFSDRILYTIRTRTGNSAVRTSYQNAYLDIDGNINRWVMKDLPAVTELPFMTSVDDYKAKLWVQLTEIRIPQQTPQYFLKSWKDIAEELRNMDTFGGQLKSRSDLKSEAESLIANEDDAVAKMQSIYGYIIESMVWNGSHRILAEEDIERVFELRKGSGAELNLLLVQLLREAGLNANPVLISTRKHGKVVEYFAIANQFNHVIVNVKIGDESYLLDATSGNSYTNMLPVKDLNGNGLLLNGDNVEWIKLESRVPTKSRVTVNAKMTDQGKIIADIDFTLQGYDALQVDSKLNETDQKDFTKSLITNHFQDVSIDSFLVDREDPDECLLNYSIYISDATPKSSQQSGERLYLNPLLFLREENNPFTQPDREVPVDFSHLFVREYVANITVPDNYTIEEVPKPKILSLPGGTAVLRRLTQVNQNRITIHSKLSITKKTFEPEEYRYLRDFFSQVVDIHGEQIVLRSGEFSPDNE